MRLFNYLTRKIEPFESKGKEVGLYTCGPTVYDFVHIGNWRTFVFEDVLKSVLKFNGYKVKHVMNITDIEDKIFKRAQEEKVPIDKITKKYEKAFLADLDKLNIQKADVYPRATESIDSIIALTEKLLEKGFAYKKEGAIYFSISKFGAYGKLSGTNVKGVKAGARVDVDEYGKENPSDFALWKKSKPGEPEFDAPFGKGRPGWHIECSAMSMNYLGESFDPSTKLRIDRFKTIEIHTGGVDLLFPHHENEIAQSETATGKKFVNFWLEGEHLLVNGEKMAKSLKNIFTLEDIIKKDFDPLALRYLFLTAHYRSKLNFTWKSLEAAQNALNNLREEIPDWDEPKIGCAEFEADFKGAIDNDLDMPQALSVMWKMIRSDYPTSAKHQSILVMDRVLGLELSKLEKSELPEGAKELIDKREELREEGKFKESDKLRKELLIMGVEVEDTAEGPKWKIKKN